MDDAISRINDFIDKYSEGSEATKDETEVALQGLIDNVIGALDMAVE